MKCHVRLLLCSFLVQRAISLELDKTKASYVAADKYRFLCVATQTHQPDRRFRYKVSDLTGNVEISLVQEMDNSEHTHVTRECKEVLDEVNSTARSIVRAAGHLVNIAYKQYFVDNNFC